jgi:hypothetical protein
MKDYDSNWLDMDDASALDFKIEQLRALANAMYCVSYLEGHRGHNYFAHSEYINEPFAVEVLAPLSLLSQRLCDEVEYHIASVRHQVQQSRGETKRNGQGKG